MLENSGVIDPERIEDYIAADGYRRLIKALTEMTPREVISEVTEERTARTRRRGISHRVEVEHGLQGRGHAEIRDLQCR